MIIVEVLAKDPLEMAFIEQDHVIQTISPDTSDHSFSVWILPGRFPSSDHFLNAHGFDPPNELGTIRTVPIPDHVLRGCVIGKGLNKLLACPTSSRGGGDIEMDNPAPVMGQDEKNEDQLEGDRVGHEEIYGDELLDVVVEKGPPGLGGRLSLLDHISGDRCLGDDDELEK